MIKPYADEEEGKEKRGGSKTGEQHASGGRDSDKDTIIHKGCNAGYGYEASPGKIFF